MSELRLTWRHTWPDKGGPDFCGEAANGQAVARIYMIESGPQSKRWFWTMTQPAGTGGIDRGVADTKAEAARLAEAAHFKAMDVMRAKGDTHELRRLES